MTTVTELLRDAFEAHPAQRIVGPDRDLDYAGFDALAASIAHALLAGGVPPGERVAVVAANSVACAASLLGVWKAGMVVVPINPSLTVPELTHTLGHAAPRAAIVDASKLEDVRVADRRAGGTISIWLTDEDVRALPPAAERWPDVEPPDVLAMLYTSGTSGRPKGVMLSQANLVFMQAAWREVTRMGPDDVVLCALPLHHSYPFVLLFLAGLAAGSALIIEPGFKFPRPLELIDAHRITVLPAVPTALQAMATLRWDRARYDLSSLRVVITGGAPLAPATRRAMRELFPQVPLYDGYGITETSPLISLGPLGVENPPGASGKPIPGVRVTLRDPDGRPTPPGEIGEVWVAGPGVMRGYYRDPAATAAVVVDGWYRSGDLGRFDDAGYLYICDRLSETIIVGGENVYPREVEAAILEYPGIVGAAVTRTEASDTGEAPIAWLVLAPNLTLSVRELLAHLRERLAPFKIPRKFEVVRELPVSAAGKVLRSALRRPPP